MKTDQFERPEGFQEHHRRKGDRQRDVRGAETILVSAETHEWIEKHPEEARKLGWSVSRFEDPLDVPIVIPSSVPKERKPREKQPARNRKNFQIRVPADAENGSEILDTLLTECKESVRAVLGFDGDVPFYYVLVAVLHDWLTDNSSSSIEEVPRRSDVEA